MKIESIPKRGRKGNVIYSETRHGKVAREYVRPRDPRTLEQQRRRSNLVAVCNRWRTLSTEERAVWRIASANKTLVTETGHRVRLNCYNFFASLNIRRADLGLSQFDYPPAQPSFNKNQVDELAASFAGGVFALKLRVPSPPAQYTLVWGAAPVRSGVRYVQHFHLLGLLPPAKDGWSDITELYVARYGVPKANQAIWIRTCQHIDGWTDVPEMTRARVRAPAP